MDTTVHLIVWISGVFLWFSSGSVFQLSFFQAAYCAHGQGCIGSPLITFTQVLRFFPFSNDTFQIHNLGHLFGVRISRRYGGPWLPLASLFCNTFLNLLILIISLNYFLLNGVWVVLHTPEKSGFENLFFLFCGRYNSAR